jgi:endonuclease YncB( thermonuclease family)
MFLRPRLSSPAHVTLPLGGIIFISGLLIGGLLVRAISPPNAGPRAGERFEPRPAAGNESRLSTDVLRVIDGDTFEARVHVWPGIDITTKVRLRGIDAPEMKANCRDEALRADASRMALQTMLSQGGVTVARVSPDKYGGRVVADAATRATADVSSAMLEAGHARRYNGGRRESWCNRSD